MDLIIEGHPAELEWCRREIEREFGDKAALEAVPATDAEELREPSIIALIVSLGGPAVVTGIVKMFSRRYKHIEDMQRISNELRLGELQHEMRLTELRLRLSDNNGERAITEEQLASLEP